MQKKAGFYPAFLVVILESPEDADAAQKHHSDSCANGYFAFFMIVIFIIDGCTSYDHQSKS